MNRLTNKKTYASPEVEPVALDMELCSTLNNESENKTLPGFGVGGGFGEGGF